ncbi:MAG: zonular occludens toxin domain-containing protein, partial [Nanoarchaeota archaeon]
VEKINIKKIVEFIESDKKASVEVKNSAISLFEAAETWGIFADNSSAATKIKDIVSGGETTVLDISVYNSVGAFNVRALVISLLSRKIFNERVRARKKEEAVSVSKGLSFLAGEERKENPLVWMFIDEAHEFLPLNEKTIATDALIQLLREGRQPGISLVLATQQPGQIHRDVMTQSDIVISHRVTSSQDIEALNYIMQSYVLESINKQMSDLPNLKGSAIILDDNSERIYPLQIRPRFTWHGGEAPTAIKAKGKAAGSDYQGVSMPYKRVRAAILRDFDTDQPITKMRWYLRRSAFFCLLFFHSRFFYLGKGYRKLLNTSHTSAYWECRSCSLR